MADINILTVVIFFISSFVLSSAAVFLILKISIKKKWFDPSEERKVHEGSIPRLAGIGFSTVFFIVVVAGGFVFWEEIANLRYLSYLAGLLIILLFGIYDDFRPLLPRYKLIVQFLAAVLVIVPGFVFRRIIYFDAGSLPAPVGYAITLLWIVGLTNAINLIDGVDGLAGGISALIAFFYGVIIFFSGGTPFVIVLCVIFIGVIAGFLAFNAPFPKAKIFMGDCGSQFLGFGLAVLPLLGRQSYYSTLPLFYAAALLLIPILDTLAAVWRRIRDGYNIGTPDRAHVHHKLMNIGLSVRGVGAVLCGLQAALGVLVFISSRMASRMDRLLSLVVLGAAYLLAIAFFITIHYLNQAANKRQLVKIQT